MTFILFVSLILGPATFASGHIFDGGSRNAEQHQTISNTGNVLGISKTKCN
jgi:hypothetical protein